MRLSDASTGADVTEAGPVSFAAISLSGNGAYPIRNLWQILVRRITMRGFLAYEHPDMLAEAEGALANWIKSGQLKATENVATGIENAPDAFIRLMSGQTVGKTVVRMSDRVTALPA